MLLRMVEGERGRSESLVNTGDIEMARRVLIKMNGQRQLGVNIEQSVGMDGANEYEDVLLIQTLFNYIAEGLGPESIGLDGEYRVPDMTGSMDGETHTAISQFQMTNASSLFRKGKFFDWCIDRASYNGLSLRSNKPVISMTLLQIKATDAALMQGGNPNGYSEALIGIQPDLAQFLNKWDI
jgi:hypothetical protein